MEKPIRVLHVIGSMNLAGAETFIMNIYRNINRERVQFDFIVHNDGEYDKEIIRLGGNIFKIASLAKSGYRKYTKDLKNILINNNYKIIHSHINESSGLVLKIAKECGIPVRISHSHSQGNHSNILYKIIKLYLKNQISKYATNFFACSYRAAKWLFRNNSDKAIIVKNGIDTKLFAFSPQQREEKRKEFNLKEDTIVLGNVGRLTNVKNQAFLIDIFEGVNKKVHDSKLIIVGEGNLEGELKNKVKKKNLEDKVIFTGSRQDVNELLNAFDVFIFPSLYEGLGIALIEAQCNGLLCIASDSVPKESKVTKNLVYISLKKDSKYWSDVILDKYNIYIRKSQEQRIKNAGYDIIEVAKQMEKFYIEKGKKYEEDFAHRNV